MSCENCELSKRCDGLTEEVERLEAELDEQGELLTAHVKMLEKAKARIAELEGARAKDAVELAELREQHRELSDQFITNAQRMGSVVDNWHNWAIEIVGHEAACKMSGQDMRDEILRRLADRAPAVQAEPMPTKRRGPGPEGPPKAGSPMVSADQAEPQDCGERPSEREGSL